MTVRKLLALAVCMSPLLAGLASAGCGANDGADEATLGAESEVNEAAAMTPEATSLWKSYVERETSGVALQPDCVPRRVSPPSGVASRGVVVLFHGFTACPQQFFEIATDLSAAGYEVLLPLLPGHGRMPKVDGPARVDDISDLPVEATRSRYAELAGEMTKIASKSRFDRFVGGLSVGGMVATSALEQGQTSAGSSVWKRGVLLAPFFRPPGAAALGLRVGGSVTPDKRQSWGPECALSTAPGKRAGICEFTLGNLRAAVRLGEEVMARASTIRVPVQLVGVEEDSAADNGEMAKLLSRLGGPKEACFYRKGVPHAFVSKHDRTELDHSWLPSLHRGLKYFVITGAPFLVRGESREHGYPLCSE